MDLTNIANIIGYSNPIEMPVSELLTGSFIFTIPSYQRGYRWESSEEGVEDNDVKQVDDLLDDLTTFAKTNVGRKANYYLQPLMVKPKQVDGEYVWDVLDGQQRLTTMLLVLTCINEKLYTNSPLKLYTLKYENRKQLDFAKITYTPTSPNYDYPLPTDNLDSYFVRKAKDKIEKWYDQELSGNPSLQDKIKELLFYPDASRGSSTPPSLRAKFIWYNIEPVTATVPNGDRIHDIEVFNRLNRGKIGLTDSELIKALFLLCIKLSPTSGSSLMTSDTLVRKWDEMGKMFQDNEFWKMLSPKNKEYSNRMDLLFDFIKDCKDGNNRNSYRYYYDKMHNLTTTPDTQQIELLWNEIKLFFDTLCKWHEDVHKHNFIGYLVENNYELSKIYRKISQGEELKSIVKECLGYADVNDIDDFSYQDTDGFIKIRKTLLLFNVLTNDKFGRKFPFNLYRDNSYDVEHVNSQTDNPIEKVDEKEEWIKEHALSCLLIDRKETDSTKKITQAAIEARDLIIEGIDLLKEFKKENKDVGNKFKPYRAKVENYYACGDSSISMTNKDAIGNLTLLNSSINREYKNALFPKKLRILKRSDQEGAYIPVCTKYMFLKYYSNPQGNVSAFSMMRWRPEDQIEYTNAIKETINKIF